MVGEHWKPITGYEAYYSVSDLGRVFAHPRRVVQSDGSLHWRPGALLTPAPANKSGHRSVTLFDAQSRRKKLWLHRLVAQHFIPNPDNLPYVLHGVHGPSDNRASQLRWGTHSDNEKDKAIHRRLRQEMQGW